MHRRDHVSGHEDMVVSKSSSCRKDSKSLLEKQLPANGGGVSGGIEKFGSSLSLKQSEFSFFATYESLTLDSLILIFAQTNLGAHLLL